MRKAYLFIFIVVVIFFDNSFAQSNYHTKQNVTRYEKGKRHFAN